MPIADQIEDARRSLLDLTLRNRLLNFRTSRARTLQLVEDDPGSLFELLCVEERKVGFRAEGTERRTVRFERRYGFWRGLLDGVVARYLDCGIFERGFARIRCPDCATEYLLAFSCKGRGLCPSCGAKRAAEFAAFLKDEVAADIGHACSSPGTIPASACTTS
jgi:Transposase zinc-binding domain/Protein of unknown function (DUF4011)